jgi:hypothetical protein
MQTLGRLYVRYFNNQYQRSGTLFNEVLGLEVTTKISRCADKGLVLGTERFRGSIFAHTLPIIMLSLIVKPPTRLSDILARN